MVLLDSSIVLTAWEKEHEWAAGGWHFVGVLEEWHRGFTDGYFYVGRFLF